MRIALHPRLAAEQCCSVAILALTVVVAWCLPTVGRDLSRDGTGLLWAQEKEKPAGKGEAPKTKDGAKKRGGDEDADESTKGKGKKKAPEEDGNEEAEDPAEPADDEEGEGAGKPTTVKRSIEEEYVRENLETYLAANSVEFLDNGSVKILLELNEKKDEWTTCFEPNVSSEGAKAFRWSRVDEEDYFRGYVQGPDGSTGQYSKGLRLGNAGMANLNCWFLDDVEAEMVYVQGTGYNKDQTSALVFTSAKGKSMGANFASQCASFQKTARGPAKGQVEPIAAWTVVKSKLVLREGMATVYKNGKKKSEMAYKPKELSSGRIGFIWAGNMASFVYRLEIVGKLDVKKMCEQMKKKK